MEIKLPSFLIGLLVGMMLITVFLTYNNGRQIGEVYTYISSRELVVCTKD